MKNNKNGWKKLVTYSTIGLVGVCLIFGVVIPAVEIIGINVLNFLLDYTQKHPVGMFIAACVLGLVAYGTTQTTPAIIEVLQKPTIDDYFIILKTIRPAVAEIASTIGLAPIDSHTDMAVNGAERILQWGKVWGFKYKARKLSATTSIDEEMICRAIQTQVAIVLEQDNPSKLTEIHHDYHGHLVPKIQIEEVKDDDAYIYIYVVMASKTYFKQKEDENNPNTLHTESDKDDPIF